MSKLDVVSGVIKLWFHSRGYGFVAADDGGSDVMLHASCLKESGIEWVTRGAYVEVLYEVRGDGRRYARQIIDIRRDRHSQSNRERLRVKYGRFSWSDEG